MYLDHVTNVEVGKMLQVTPITEKMCKTCLCCYSHELRSSENLMAKTALYLNLEVQQTCDRPKKGWLDRVIEDMLLSHRRCLCSDQVEKGVQTLLLHGIVAKDRRSIRRIYWRQDLAQETRNPFKSTNQGR